MFKFNFDDPETSTLEELETKTDQEIQGEIAVSECNDFKAKFVEDGCQVCKECSENSHVEKVINQRTFFVFDTELAESHIKSSQDSADSLAVLEALESHSDLIKKKYEGGLKIWECGVDLVNFCITQNIDFNNKKVLELGCGAGLPGIYAKCCGAKMVFFQDYNFEVLKHFTYPCIELNKGSCRKNDTACNYRLISGDWSSLPVLLINHTFDVILTAETIYNTDSYPALHNIFSKLLSATGVIYVAAKTTYFGVGGSVNEFMSYVKSQGVFSAEASLIIPGGVPRIILELKRKLDPT